MNRETYSAYDREGRRKYLTHTEGRRFLKCSRKLPRSEALFCMTIYYTGMRISEALAIALDDIDDSIGDIRIRSLKKRESREFRRIPLPKALLSGLRALAGEGTNERLWLFSRTTAWRIIKRVMAQIPLHLLQLWFGHSQATTTAIYLDVRDDEERTLIQRTWK